MKTMTLYLDYDARQKLHSLPFEEIAPATEDVYLRLLPQAEGVFEARGMAAVRKNYISTRDIQRALWAATSVLPKAKDGVVGLLLPGTLYVVGCGEGTGLSKHPAQGWLVFMRNMGCGLQGRRSLSRQTDSLA